MSEEVRKQKLKSVAEMVGQMSDAETATMKIVAESMQLGYDIAKAETKPA